MHLVQQPIKASLLTHVMFVPIGNQQTISLLFSYYITRWQPLQALTAMFIGSFPDFSITNIELFHSLVYPLNNEICHIVKFVRTTIVHGI